ncbi:BQ5605_C014g07424 [Microbotryum silenes-dioicae]|uniref:BQ5605_C014g07424 protein n=1 Tax=Microbotryum silenes-dioicae TaxID=796604 RepID=A0A2X0LXM0_9BASI|nr:BQ5605_C014g07424 [Microbotryum silenes-dioicae]
MYMELSRFDFHFKFIPGKDNHVADSLSQMWESPNVTVQPMDHVQGLELDDLFFDAPSGPPAKAGAHLAPVRRATSPVPIDEDDDPLNLLGQMPNDPLAPVLQGLLTPSTPCSWFGKLVHLLPLPSDATLESVAKAFYRHVYKHHGVPSSIVSDRDPKFMAHFWKVLQRKVGTELRMSTSAHPQTNGASKNWIKMVVQSLRLLCAGTPDNWASCLTEAEFALNSATAGATRFSGFETTCGFQPRAWPVDTWAVTDANKHWRPDSAEFQVGNKVYLSTKNLAFPPGQSQKFLARYIGPFTIVAAHPATSNYDLDLPPEMSRVLPRFHASLLRPHFPNDDKRFPGRSFQQCMIEDAANPASDFAAINVVLNNHFRNNHCLFLVRFVGRLDTDNVWINEAVLHLQAPSRLDEYIRRLDRQGCQLAGPTHRRRVNSGGGIM